MITKVSEIDFEFCGSTLDKQSSDSGSAHIPLLEKISTLILDIHTQEEQVLERSEKFLVLKSRDYVENVFNNIKTNLPLPSIEAPPSVESPYIYHPPEHALGSHWSCGGVP